MIIEKIREHSSVLHRDMEGSRLLLPLANGIISMDHYIEVLQKFYAFFSLLEESIKKTSIDKYLPDFASRRKSELLLEDLRILGRDIKISTDVSIPKVNSTAYAIGCQYVMEGSTLGGKFIFENVQRNLNISEISGGSFFYGYGKETGMMWKVFLGCLQKFYAEENGEEEILEGVKDTFRLLKLWLDKNAEPASK